jgi:hypothetical protein
LTVKRMWTSPLPSPASHSLGSDRPVSPSVSARAAIPARNAGGKESRIGDGIPIAASPRWLSATFNVVEGFSVHRAPLVIRGSASATTALPDS